MDIEQWSGLDRTSGHIKRF